MYKLDKSYCKAQSFAEAEKDNLFLKTDSLSERLNQAWYLTATIYGMDPLNPAKMQKHLSTLRKHSK